jgi:hypothetical protein
VKALFHGPQFKLLNKDAQRTGDATRTSSRALEGGVDDESRVPYEIYGVICSWLDLRSLRTK